MPKLTLDSHFTFYKYVCYYTYEKYKDKIPDFQYFHKAQLDHFSMFLGVTVTILNIMLKCVVQMT